MTLTKTSSAVEIEETKAEKIGSPRSDEAKSPTDDDVVRVKLELLERLLEKELITAEEARAKRQELLRQGD
jgi:hypothetical protein